MTTCLTSYVRTLRYAMRCCVEALQHLSRCRSQADSTFVATMIAKVGPIVCYTYHANQKRQWRAVSLYYWRLWLGVVFVTVAVAVATSVASACSWPCDGYSRTFRLRYPVLFCSFTLLTLLDFTLCYVISHCVLGKKYQYLWLWSCGERPIMRRTVFVISILLWC